MSSTDTENAVMRQVNRVKQQIERGELRDAAENLNKLVRTIPTHPYPYMLGMRLAEASRNAPAALQSAERAVECAPQWPIAVIELAALLARQGKRAEAVQQARRAVELGGDQLDVLTRAIDVAHASFDWDTALPWLQRARAIAPDNRLVALAAARNAVRRRAHAEALPIFGELLAGNPDDQEVLAERLSSADASGDQALAQADAERLLQLDPDNETYRFWHARSRGEVPANQPREMVERLFDGYAATFDRQLVTGLKYDMPQRVAEIVRATHPDLDINVLDLGCGTGLVGVYLGRVKGFMIGVDISEKMIEQAARHELYDRFHLVDVLEALAHTPEGLYHVVTACDVFVYIGDLSQAIPNAFKVLRPGGDFIFSCESAMPDEPPYLLRDSIRYAHRPDAIEALCRQAGFEPVQVQPIDLRLEGGKPVGGFYVVARKPG